jgi:hypothetical protein
LAGASRRFGAADLRYVPESAWARAGAKGAVIDRKRRRTRRPAPLCASPHRALPVNSRCGGGCARATLYANRGRSQKSREALFGRLHENPLVRLVRARAGHGHDGDDQRSDVRGYALVAVQTLPTLPDCRAPLRRRGARGHGLARAVSKWCRNPLAEYLRHRSDPHTAGDMQSSRSNQAPSNERGFLRQTAETGSHGDGFGRDARCSRSPPASSVSLTPAFAVPSGASSARRRAHGLPNSVDRHQIQSSRRRPGNSRRCREVTASLRRPRFGTSTT